MHTSIQNIETGLIDQYIVSYEFLLLDKVSFQRH